MPWASNLRSRAKHAVQLAEAVLLLTAASKLVRLFPRRASAVLVRALSNGVDIPRVEPALSTDIVRAVQRAERYVPRNSCLSRAVTSCLMLRRRGVRATIRVGARRDMKGGLLAHAWLESGVQRPSIPPPGEYAEFSKVA